MKELPHHWCTLAIVKNLRVAKTQEGGESQQMRNDRGRSGISERERGRERSERMRG